MAPYYCVSLLAADDSPHTRPHEIPQEIPNPSEREHGAAEPLDDIWWQNWNNAPEMESRMGDSHLTETKGKLSPWGTNAS